ncbi:uncharacterized protein LOC111710184 [Eurytemora carolleeae]|uniref:uncharacterized protein LOC111710184 n=1 Tax=Eurytemora carolleeae TaxID=1294199 RepID=UPI000C7926FF|nr:uncharacterized protein LOC111710184 [Eurytemora carolleeae]|eukprot:XP_023340009.1 uncharacterized protein LOC111710184 [Eurytemora affinis]
MTLVLMQEDKTEVRLRNKACKLLDRPAPAPYLNLLREGYELRIGFGSTQTFKRKLSKGFVCTLSWKGMKVYGAVSRIASESDDLMVKIWDLYPFLHDTGRTFFRYVIRPSSLVPKSTNPTIGGVQDLTGVECYYSPSIQHYLQ